MQARYVCAGPPAKDTHPARATSRPLERAPHPDATREATDPLALDPGLRSSGLGLLGAAICSYFGLVILFPGQLDSIDQTNALQALGLLALVSSGVVYARGVKLGEAARNAAIWIGIAAIALIGYSFRTELSDAFVKVRGEVIPAYAISTTPHEMTVTRSADGGFYILGQINGAPVRFVIDTGANGVLLSPDDAKRAGMDVDKLKYAAPAETANGVGYMAPIILPQLEVGEMKLSSVQAAVNKAPMSSSLLGMAFLRQLDSVEIRGDTLTLKWKSQEPAATARPAPVLQPSPRTT